MQRWYIKILMMFCLVSPTFAADSSDGCGAGWYIAKDHTLISTTTRGTTNAFLPPTLSMTFGTSNCKSHPIVEHQEAYDLLVHQKQGFRMDIARGEGDYLDALASTLDCFAYRQQMSEILHSSYKDIFLSSKNPTLAIYDVLAGSYLARLCHLS